MGSGDGFLGEWLLFPYPLFVLLPYSKYESGDDTLFVLLKMYIQDSLTTIIVAPPVNRRGFSLLLHQIR